MKALSCLLIILCVSCGDDNFRKVDRLVGFRVLAILADAPEVAPGGTVNLQLFVSDPQGAGRTVTAATASCVDPGVSVGATVSCDHDPTRVSGSYAVDTSTPDFVSNLRTGLAAPLSVTVPATILQNRSPREQFNGVSYIVIFDFEVDGERLRTFKRIIATNRGTLNTNPSGSVLLKNNLPFDGTLRKDDGLSVTGTGVESNDYLNIDGSQESRLEQIDVSWYVSHGELDRPKTFLGEETEYQDTPPDSTMLLVSIIRDDRGGVEVMREVIP
ncbi:MAG TPA: hypothetical protein VNJ01_17570 [Bacteriovoracaceae bacterium]|nr:hypothetical protein [Bacteriovoracaceae bacterium]